MTGSVEVLLRNTIRGLNFVSETDAPYELVLLGTEPVSTAVLRGRFGLTDDVPVREISLSEMLGTQDRFESRLQSLRATMEKTFVAVHVFRLGDVEVRYVIAGAADGQWYAITTTAIETG
jgi:hypothetical protein